MYDLVKEKGWLKVTDFDKYDTTKPIFETPWLSMEALGTLHEQLTTTSTCAQATSSITIAKESSGQSRQH